MNSIREWLNGKRPYATGVALYNVYGREELLKRSFAQGHSTYRQTRLEDALRELMEGAERPAVAQASPQAKVVYVNEDILPEVAVPELKDPYREQWLPLYIQMNALRHTLISAANDEERGKMAHGILRLERDCNRWWKKRDYLLRTGQELQEPDEEALPITDHNKISRRVNNLRTYISKQRPLLENDVTKEAAQAKIDTYTLELKKLEQQLANAAGGA